MEFFTARREISLLFIDGKHLHENPGNSTALKFKTALAFDTFELFIF